VITVGTNLVDHRCGPIWSISLCSLISINGSSGRHFLLQRGFYVASFKASRCRLSGIHHKYATTGWRTTSAPGPASAPATLRPRCSGTLSRSTGSHPTHDQERMPERPPAPEPIAQPFQRAQHLRLARNRAPTGWPDTTTRLIALHDGPPLLPLVLVSFRRCRGRLRRAGPGRARRGCRWALELQHVPVVKCRQMPTKVPAPSPQQDDVRLARQLADRHVGCTS